MNGNMFKVKQWAKVLDTCFTTYQVTDHANDIYGDPADPFSFQNDSGLGSADVGDTVPVLRGVEEADGLPADLASAG